MKYHLNAFNNNDKTEFLAFEVELPSDSEDQGITISGGGLSCNLLAVS
ncbi:MULTISPECIES: hypothetical protein [unclassified Pseudomonas]|nr:MULTISPECIES: hypothetical protein [unclassified Pseudomonas]MEB0042303.1 hypothetical protein [Pseudomonas sp. MH10]MEB0078833.1 hypothetical protein [Pseudomonas sp. MH10out]MEB0089738.1 hypothetical protein [Pseudomonas sp. CCI4.2]MEB0102991.1 hypothetical protein [Pseudomonas sp. CCI3.2]MEB0121532.1 hypothetical protein [Pseudomonas sp. CCI1.2]